MVSKAYLNGEIDALEAEKEALTSMLKLPRGMSSLNQISEMPYFEAYQWLDMLAYFQQFPENIRPGSIENHREALRKFVEKHS